MQFLYTEKITSSAIDEGLNTGVTFMFGGIFIIENVSVILSTCSCSLLLPATGHFVDRAQGVFTFLFSRTILAW